MAKFVGRGIKRREDPRFVTGAAQFADDINLPGILSALILRSPHAHAKIDSIDARAARELEGVASVLTGADLKDKIGPIPCLEDVDYKPFQPVLADSIVRYMGEPIAVAVAANPYLAQDALDLINADFEPLEAVIDPEEAIEPGGPIIHGDFGSNLLGQINSPPEPIDLAASGADRIVRLKLLSQRLAPLSMEARGVVACWDAGSRKLTLWSSTQIPHTLRSSLAKMLRVGENRIRIITPDVGGAFGSKRNVYREEALIAYLAMTLGRPIKWIERRRENLAATIHGRGQTIYAEAAAATDGRILGLKARFVCDLGAYLQLHTPRAPRLAGLMMSQGYTIDRIGFQQQLAFTNKTATDVYRGPGETEACCIAERAMDLIGEELGIDPAEIRRRNFIPPQAFPFKTATGLIYDSGDYARALDKALELGEYKKLRMWQAAERRQGRYPGIGVACYVELTGVGPRNRLPASQPGWETATVRIEPDSTVKVLTGTAPHGQGQYTAIAQLVADAFGIDIDDISVGHGDTDAIEYGAGTWGSRGTTVGGAAVMKAVAALTAKLRLIASHLMEAPPDRFVFAERALRLSDDREKSLPFERVVKAAYESEIPHIEPGLSATSFYEPSDYTYSFGVHISLVEADPETGVVKLLRYVIVDDCGEVINPLLVEGQMHGGASQGIAQALYEEILYDESGQLLTGTLADYAVPKATMLPRFDVGHTVTPSAVNPAGFKGCGEGPTIGATACVLNAVFDALRPFGIRDLDMPLKPERVWRAIRSARAAKNG